MSTAENHIENSKQHLQSAERYGKKAVEETTESAGRVKEDVKKGINEIGNAFRNASSSLVEGAQTVAHDTYDTLKTEGKRKAEQLEGEIQRSPFLAMGIAFAGGILLSSLLRR